MTQPVHPIDLPAASLLKGCRESGAFADCYTCEVAGAVSHADFVAAFYTTRLFKLERFVLRWLARCPATDADAKLLGEGKADRFSAWHVEAREANQLLLADFTGRTKSWLMVGPAAGGNGAPRTQLYFGSAVLPRPRRSTTEKARMGVVFHALNGFHRLYSRLLLSAARSRLLRRNRPDVR